ncbi:GntR family transcriptional regulator [Microbacterium fluvii]|uniref:GntR family transcriptional regulator n=1 Tax=Microbacterium fluvii TaxID=415215 RepID=A0ABW2HC04_9MICO|nr:GntR family transcriptional regulator [Microbacterium fluvii]MCU4671180.1 GntR family transcriptional regulator [Microbacterium fluvii]
MDATDVSGAADIHRELPVAIHAQISDGFRAKIASGEWPSHYRLKSEPELAAELGVSRGTLRRAMTTLIEEGLLRQVRGRGTFVTSTTIEPAIAQKLSTLSEDFANQGVVTTTRVIECTLIDPPRPVAALLEVPAGGMVLKLVRLRSTESGPVVLLFNYVRTDFAPGIETVDFATASLFGTLEGRYSLRISSARRTFSAEAAQGDVAELLQIAPGGPVQYLEQVTYLSNDKPVEYSDVWIHSGRLRVTSMLSRR